LSIKKHYGYVVTDWVRDVLRGREVHPLVLCGPAASGKSHLIKGLSYWVRTHCIDHLDSFNNGLEFARVLYAEGGTIDAQYYEDKWVTIKSPICPPYKILNRFALICATNDPQQYSALPGAAIVRLEANGINLGNANEMIARLIQ
jgi:hypothetical protein